MGIKFRCQTCDKKLHVKSFLAGKRGVCPKCGAKIRIPAQSDPTLAVEEDPVEQRPPGGSGKERRSAAEPHRESPSSPVAQKAASLVRPPGGSVAGSPPVADPITEAPDAVWYVRPPSGGQFGPADGTVMRRWLGEGRISADALVWREGWPDWKSAGPIFPSLEVFQGRVSEATSLLPADAPTNGEFGLSKDRSVATRPGARVRSKRSGRNVAIVVALALMCVGLVVALYIVLRAQG
ncbi:MAG: DUF4339 domain-containing protein [Pirellulaceae bacterium]